MRNVLLLALLAVSISCATSGATPYPRELFGIRPGTRRADAHTKLQAVGKFVRDEAKRQEVWTVEDPRWTGAIVGFDREERVRFITAVARPDGERVRYSEVVDVATAKHRTTGSTHRYAAPRCRVVTAIDIGSDPQDLTYYSLKRVRDEGEEEEEDE